MNTTLTLVDLGGAIALLIWGVHMVQTGITRAFGPAMPGHTELFARQPASSPIMMRLPRPMAARTTKLYGPP